MNLSKGQRIKLDNNVYDITLSGNFTGVLDFSCFGLDCNEKLSDDRYMIFYGQLNSPDSAIQLIENSHNKNVYHVDFNKLDNKIEKLVFTASIDGNEEMRMISNITLSLGAYQFILDGSMFQQEKAIIFFELYKKENIWRLMANGNGFNGGLSSLVVNFGGEVMNNDHNVTTTYEEPKKQKISLVKTFEEKAPELVSLAKKATISLEKNNLNDIHCKVAFILDASGSMTSQYQNGDVQKVVNRVFPLAVHFNGKDDLNIWRFALHEEKGNNINFLNYKNYVNEDNNGWKSWMSRLNSGYNNEPIVMEAILKHYFNINVPQPVNKLFSTNYSAFDKLPDLLPPQEPLFVIFISDGGVSKNEYIKSLIKWSSKLPVFWQFIGIGGNYYGALEEFDNLPGRFIDNADFFDLDTLDSLTEDELYLKMTQEFPNWLKEARTKNLINI